MAETTLTDAQYLDPRRFRQPTDPVVIEHNQRIRAYHDFIARSRSIMTNSELLDHAAYWHGVRAHISNTTVSTEVKNYLFVWYCRRYSPPIDLGFLGLEPPDFDMAYLRAMSLPVVYARMEQWHPITDLVYFDWYSPPPEIDMILRAPWSQLDVLLELDTMVLRWYRAYHDQWYDAMWRLIQQPLVINNANIGRMSGQLCHWTGHYTFLLTVPIRPMPLPLYRVFEETGRRFREIRTAVVRMPMLFTVLCAWHARRGGGFARLGEMREAILWHAFGINSYVLAMH